MRSLVISMLQSKTSWHDSAANRDMFGQLLDQVPLETQLVLLPEMFNTGFSMASTEIAETMAGETLAWLAGQAQRLDKVICGSLVIVDDGAYYNRFVCVTPVGEVTCYDKRHRFRMAGEHKHYSAGGEKIVFNVEGWRICPMVCYDLRFPVWFRNDDAYDVLVCVANWPAARQAAWNTLLRARAIENQAYVAGVNVIGVDGNEISYGGGSGVYAPDGEVMAEADDRPQIITRVLEPGPLLALREKFPVWQDADRFQINE